MISTGIGSVVKKAASKVANTESQQTTKKPSAQESTQRPSRTPKDTYTPSTKNEHHVPSHKDLSDLFKKHKPPVGLDDKKRPPVWQNPGFFPQKPSTGIEGKKPPVWQDPGFAPHKPPTGINGQQPPIWRDPGFKPPEGINGQPGKPITLPDIGFEGSRPHFDLGGVRPL